jgi:hypothetical protein
MDFGVWAMLIGLTAVAIPPIIHLLNRRRYDVVDWGAMQFLKIGEVTRRRLMLEELLLMLLRMGLIAVLVLGLAAPALTEPVLNWWAGVTGTSPTQVKGARPNYDFVLIFDGSASMSYSPNDDGQTLHDAAKKWAMDFVGDLIPGDRVAVLRAGQQVTELQAEPSLDLERVRDKISTVPPPEGGVDWPAAVERAAALLAKNKRPERAVILLSDGQRYGWANPETRDRWTLLAGKLGLKKPDARGLPALYYINLDPERKDTDEPPNWALGPLEVSKPVVPLGQEVRFRCTLELRGQKEDYHPPYRLSLWIDGKAAGELKPPRRAKVDHGRVKVPFEFRHRFDAEHYRAGSHLIAVQLEVDPPPDKRPEGYVVRDRIPADNRREFSLEVLESLPVLIVDGDPDPRPPHRGSDFLRIALTPRPEREKDAVSAVQARVVSIDEFNAAQLLGPRPAPEGVAAPADREAGRPRVLILSNVAKLSSEQQQAVDQFLADGGGVLVTLGDRVQAGPYNDELFRAGRGWLPAKLVGIEGDEEDLKKALRPGPSTHPALTIPLTLSGADLADARFPRWWKIAPPSREEPGLVVAPLRSALEEHPFLVERPYRAGRVLLCAVPLDSSWNANVTDLQSFVPLAHELVYYLARARSAEYNLAAGQPLRWRLDSGAPQAGFTMQPPGDKKPRPLTTDQPDDTSLPARIDPQPRGALLVYEKTRETGVYRLGTPEGQTVNYVVQPDDKESDLTPCSADDRDAVAGQIGVKYEDDRARMIAALTPTGQRMEVWWWFLIGIVLLLCAEVWMTRRMVKSRAA